MSEHKYFVDTNIFLRVLTKDKEKEFQDCFNFLTMVADGQINARTSNLVLAEVNWVLLKKYKFSKQKVIRGLFSILYLPNLKFEDKTDINVGIQIFDKFSVKFIDALIASNPRVQKKEMIIVSYDKDFDKLGIKRLEPSALIH